MTETLKAEKYRLEWRVEQFVNFKTPPTAAFTAAAVSPVHSTDAFVPCSCAHLHPPLLNLTPPSLSSLLSPGFFGDLLWEEWGAIKATAVCFRLQNPRPPSIRQSQSSYLLGPSGKPHTLEEKYLICPLSKDQQSHKWQGRPSVAREGGRRREEKEVVVLGENSNDGCKRSLELKIQ